VSCHKRNSFCFSAQSSIQRPKMALENQKVIEQATTKNKNGTEADINSISYFINEVIFISLAVCSLHYIIIDFIIILKFGLWKPESTSTTTPWSMKAEESEGWGGPSSPCKNSRTTVRVEEQIYIITDQDQNKHHDNALIPKSSHAKMHKKQITIVLILKM
jgi:hypothetical protein